MPPCNRRSLLVALIALGEDLALRRRPAPVNTSSRRTGSGLGLCKSAVSDTCPTRSIQRSDIRRSAPGVEFGVQRSLTVQLQLRRRANFAAKQRPPGLTSHRPRQEQWPCRSAGQVTAPAHIRPSTGVAPHECNLHSLLVADSRTCPWQHD
jgi:hypothetical protein